MRVGVLGFQGAIEPHIQMLHRCGAEPVRVQTREDLKAIDALILPGGESTTMLKLIERNDFWEPLFVFCSRNPVWGTCAGAILLAKEVKNPAQRSLGLINIAAERNSYGSQRESFKATLAVTGLADSLEVDFIRAPRLSPLSPQVAVLSRYHEEPVLLRENHILVSSFHTELGDDCSLHKWFLTSIAGR